MRTRLAAVLALAGIASAATPASAAATTVIDAGGARAYVHADPVASLAAVDLFVRAGLDRETPEQNGLAALVAQAVLQTPVAPAAGATPVALADAVAAGGGSITYAVLPGYVRFSLQGTPEAIAVAAPLVARALAAPSFAGATLSDARSALGDRIADDELDVRTVGQQMLRGSYYVDGAGLPAYGNPGSLSALADGDAKAFYGAWYLRGDAFLTVVGRTGPATDAASRALIAALRAGSAAPTAVATRPFGPEPKRILTHRDVAAPYVAVGFAAPPIGDPDFAATLVMRSILVSVFERGSATTPAPYFRSVGSMYAYDTSPAHFVVWINGGRVDPSTGLGAVIAVVKGTATKPLSETVLTRYKETARGEWALETLSLDDRAAAIGNAVALGLDADAGDAIPAAISAVTIADLQRVAKKYFQKFDIALVIPREASGG